MAGDTPLILRNFLVQRYEHLKRMLTSKLGNADLAGDALQETWLRLQRDEVTGSVRNPQAYVMRIAINFAIDVRRGQSQILSSEEIDELLETMPHSAPGPAQVAEDRSQLQALCEILESLPAQRREILLLVRYEGWSQKDVAKQMGLSLRAVEYELKTAQDHCTVRLAQRNGSPCHDH